MSFRDCIVSARQQGVLSPEEADDLIRRYETHRRANADKASPEDAAKEALAKDMEAEAARRRRLRDLAGAKQDEIWAGISAYRDAKDRPDIYEAVMRLLESYGFTGYSSVKGRAQSIVSLVHGELADALNAFERNFYTGIRHTKPLARDVIREMLGEATGRPEAKAFADAINGVNERLRERFNAAGGDIGRLEGGYLPQWHDPLALYKTGYDKWRDFVLPRLDLQRMKDPLTGGPFTPERLGEALKAAYDTIVSDGVAGREPSLAHQGAGALANQRAEHRFLHFKSADDWLAYHEAFGGGSDPIVTLFQHVNSMARDIAALEVLGPNPNATVEWLKQIVQSEHQKALDGKASLFRLTNRSEQARLDAAKVASQHIEDLWQWVRGRKVVSQRVATWVSSMRNFLASAQLGSAVVTAATTDPMIERMARQALGISERTLLGDNAKVYLDAVSRFFEQVPIAKSLSHLIDHMTGAPREQALRAGMIADDFLHILGDEARYAGTLRGPAWSRWLADRTMMLTGLTPLTDARRAVFQLETQGFLADLADKPFDALPTRLATKLKGYGIDAAGWDAMRKTPQYRPAAGSAGLLRPADIAAGGNSALAERYIEMLLGETERAVPTSTLRSKAYFIGSLPKGKVGSELYESFLQYRSFSLSIFTLQLEALAHEGGLGSASGLSYASQLFLTTTLGGAMALQLKNLANGRDPQKMDNYKFLIAAASTGGGLGILGDFAFADYSRYGQSLGQTMAGPLTGMVGDFLDFTLGNATKLPEGQPTNMGAGAVRLLSHYTPFLSSAWQFRLAYKRLLLDPLQRQIDPRASRRWRNEARRAQRERGQGYWWPSGEASPARAPDWSNVKP